jgi:hypothetical protein
MSLTNYAASSEHDPLPAPMHLLDFNGLRQIVQFIDRIRREGRYPSTDSQGEPCSSTDSGYD